MKSIVEAILLSLSILLALLTAHAEAGARQIVGRFEVSFDRDTYELSYNNNDATIQPLVDENEEPSIDVTRARIHNILPGNYRHDTEIYCVLRSVRAGIVSLSPVFSAESPLAEPFSAAETLLCMPYVDVDPNQRGQGLDDRPTVFFEDSSHRFSMRKLRAWPRYTIDENEEEDRRFTKVAMLVAPAPGTVCQISVRWGESIFLREGESFEDELGIDIALVNCYIERARS